MSSQTIRILSLDGMEFLLFRLCRFKKILFSKYVMSYLKSIPFFLLSYSSEARYRQAIHQQTVDLSSAAAEVNHRILSTTTTDKDKDHHQMVAAAVLVPRLH